MTLSEQVVRVKMLLNHTRNDDGLDKYAEELLQESHSRWLESNGLSPLEPMPPLVEDRIVRYTARRILRSACVDASHLSRMEEYL